MTGKAGTVQRTHAGAHLLGAHILAERIARDIQCGTLPPGTWLRQIALERRYAASRGDVRRALDELVAKRLVQHHPNRGHHVFDLEPGRMEDLRELRGVLEAAIAERIYDRADAAALAGIEARAAAFEAAVTKALPLDQHAANIAFHLALFALCPNPELVQAAIEARARLPSALLSQWTSDGWIEQSVRDHRETIAALRARDRDRLRGVMLAHLRLPSSRR